jgi:hypothetical protein
VPEGVVRRRNVTKVMDSGAFAVTFSVFTCNSADLAVFIMRERNAIWGEAGRGGKGLARLQRAFSFGGEA